MTFIKKNLLTFVLLLLILTFSLFLRLYNLSSVPNGLHIDEASLGYNGYSLLLTGKDENNNKLPLYIDMFGDNRPSGYHYLTIIPIKFFGLTEFSTRLPGALFGAFMILPMFFLTQILFKNKLVSLVSAVFTAIAPWSVVLSRASAETIVALFLILSGYALFIFGLKKRRSTYLLIGVVLLVLSFFFYHTPRVFVPILIFATVFYLFPVWKSFAQKQKAYLILALLIISFISFSLVFLLKGGTGRFGQVNIFGYPEVKLVMEEQIREDGAMKLPVLVTRTFHNKIVNYSLGLASNYLQYFSGSFLFIDGGRPLWYKVPSMGLIYLVELPFILVGVFYLLSSKDLYHKLPLIWLALAPVTASFTIDDTPNLQRAIVMFPMIELIAAYGLFMFLSRFSAFKFKKIIFAGAVVLFLYNFSYFLGQYFIQSQIHQNWYRYEGFNKMMSIINYNYSNSNQIVISKSFGGIYPLVLFYNKYNPATYQKEGSPKDRPGAGFGKFIFASSECPSYNLDPKIPRKEKSIFVDNGTCPDYKGLKTFKNTYVTRKDGTKAFRIVYE